MADFDLLKELIVPGTSKIVLLVMDGLGGIPREPNGPTELEQARTPHLDRLASEGSLGLIVPVRPGSRAGAPADQPWNDRLVVLWEVGFQGRPPTREHFYSFLHMVSSPGISAPTTRD